MLKNKKASVLVYSLIILSVMLLIAVAFSTTSVISRKNASTTSKSSQSFQIADSGVNLVLKEIKDAATGATINSLGTCASGKITLTSTNGLRSGSTADVTFTDASGSALNCSDDVSEIDHVKSVGKFADTARAVEVAVAAGILDCTEYQSAFAFGAASQSCTVTYPIAISGGCDSNCAWISKNYISGNTQNCEVATNIDPYCIAAGQRNVRAVVKCCK